MLRDRRFGVPDDRGVVKKTMAAIFSIVTATMPAAAHKNPAQDSKVRFEFAYVDRLDNFYRGIQGQQLKEVQKRLGRYGDVCYTHDTNTSDYVFFVHTKAATYQVHSKRRTTMAGLFLGTSLSLAPDALSPRPPRMEQR